MPRLRKPTITINTALFVSNTQTLPEVRPPSWRKLPVINLPQARRICAIPISQERALKAPEPSMRLKTWQMVNDALTALTSAGKLSKHTAETDTIVRGNGRPASEYYITGPKLYALLCAAAKDVGWMHRVRIPKRYVEGNDDVLICARCQQTKGRAAFNARRSPAQRARGFSEYYISKLCDSCRPQLHKRRLNAAMQLRQRRSKRDPMAPAMPPWYPLLVAMRRIHLSINAVLLHYRKRDGELPPGNVSHVPEFYLYKKELLKRARSRLRENIAAFYDDQQINPERFPTSWSGLLTDDERARLRELYAATHWKRKNPELF